MKLAPAGACLAAWAALALCAPVWAQDHPQGSPQYPSMAPVAQYRIASSADEIALARSAAPPSISGEADVWVLGARGYEKAIKGTNGFACIVERSWGADPDDAEFWNPKLRGPACFNEPAAQSALPQYLKRTEWVLAGADKLQIRERTRAAFASLEFTAPKAGAMCYMLSPRQYLSDAGGRWLPHLMFFVGAKKPAAWGANAAGSPIIGFASKDDPSTLFIVPVRTWSDGTPAPNVTK
ncbi:MAG TPA: hypothetical protein VMT51_00020 [Dongiaceae bacterium]|nr:hypothetical protein [Dongiaceae bacterium]